MLLAGATQPPPASQARVAPCCSVLHCPCGSLVCWWPHQLSASSAALSGRAERSSAGVAGIGACTCCGGCVRRCGLSQRWSARTGSICPCAAHPSPLAAAQPLPLRCLSPLAAGLRCEPMFDDRRRSTSPSGVCGSVTPKAPRVEPSSPLALRSGRSLSLTRTLKPTCAQLGPIPIPHPNPQAHLRSARALPSNDGASADTCSLPSSAPLVPSICPIHPPHPFAPFTRPTHVPTRFARSMGVGRRRAQRPTSSAGHGTARAKCRVLGVCSRPRRRVTRSRRSPFKWARRRSKLGHRRQPCHCATGRMESTHRCRAYGR
jgi:hypothetical protein